MPEVRVRKRNLNLSSAGSDEVPLSRRRNRRKILFGADAQKQAAMEAEEVNVRRAYESSQIQDPFKSAYTSALNSSGPENILPPPYNPYTLLRFPNENNTLRQCIDAMVINIESMGHRLEYIGPEGQEDATEAQREKARIEALLDQPNGEYSLIELRERCRRDKETFGYYFIEICRGVFNQDIVSYYHVPGHTMRLTTADAEETEVSIWLMRNGKYTKQKIKKRFRRFVQEIGNRKVYFKEYGDPRRISARNGKADNATPDEELATEIYMGNLYNPGSPYGVPRWINQLPAIMGSRESELTNLQFFKDNAIPAMAVMVSGGHLTSDSIDEIEELVYSVQGRGAVHRVMVLEATADRESAGPDGKLNAPRIELKPMVHDRQNDALFQEYDKNNQAKVRSSFRLPPIFIGRSEDHTQATASSSLIMAESQVFGPERNKMDDLFTFVVLSDKEGRPPSFWAFRSNPPRISDPKTVVDALDVFEQVGALTPNISIGIANELFDLNIPNISESWGDYPFELVMGLANQGRLKGLELISDPTANDQTSQALDNANQALDNLNLPPDQQQVVNEKIIEPLKQLVNVGNVRKVQKRLRVRPRRRS